MKKARYFRSLLALFFTALPALAFAAGYDLIQPLPGLSTGVSLSDYLRGIFKLLIGVAGLLAVVMLVICGIRVMASASSSGKSAAKECLWNAVLGILLAVSSWIILNTINPNLVTSGVTLQQVTATPSPGAPGPGKPGGPAATTDPMPTLPGWYFRFKDTDGNTRNSTSFASSEECLATQREYEKYPGISIENGPNGTPGCFQIFRTTETPSGSETATRQSLCGNDSCVSSSATNVYINNGPCVGGQTRGCTNVAGLPGNAVSFIQSLPGACSSCMALLANKTVPGVKITGGTEPGHASHGVDRPIFDIGHDKGLLNFIEQSGLPKDASFCGTSVVNGSRCYTKWLYNGWWFTDEGDHFHVCQDGWTGAGTGIACKKSTS